MPTQEIHLSEGGKVVLRGPWPSGRIDLLLLIGPVETMVELTKTERTELAAVLLAGPKNEEVEDEW